MKQLQQHVAAEQQRDRDQCAGARERQQDHADLEIVEARLHRQEQDREHVLQHQDAERDAAGQGVELALLV